MTIQQAQLIAFYHHMGCQAIAGYPIEAGLLRLEHQCGYLVTADIQRHSAFNHLAVIKGFIQFRAGVRPKIRLAAIIDTDIDFYGVIQRITTGVFGLQRQFKPQTVI